MSETIYVGIDIGGTNTKVGVCDVDGKLLHHLEGPTLTEQGSDAVLDVVAKYVRQVVAESGSPWEQVAAIGIGVPGTVDPEQGLVRWSPNLRWENVHLRRVLERELDKKIMIENDANVAALGEAWSGSGQGISHAVCYTLGTGVGGGIIIDGKLYRGFRGMAGEMGHMQVVPDLEAIQCSCGHMGCLETVSSATGIVRMANDAVARGDRTDLTLLETITAKDVFDAAKADDDVALRIVQRAAYYVGKSMATIAIVLNPKRFIIGGGVSRAGEILFEPIRESFVKYTPVELQNGVDIVPASLGNTAGMIGAAGLTMAERRG